MKLQTLAMLLITPIQRLPRYKLRLAEVIKHTWKDHRDMENLEDALNQIKDVAKYVNEVRCCAV